MTNQENTTLVPIKKRFDEEGRPSCAGCAFVTEDHEGFLGCSQDFERFIGHSPRGLLPGPLCPVHNPREGMKAL